MSEPVFVNVSSHHFCAVCVLNSTRPSVELFVFEILYNFQNEKLHLNILKIRFTLLDKPGAHAHTHMTRFFTVKEEKVARTHTRTYGKHLQVIKKEKKENGEINFLGWISLKIIAGHPFNKCFSAIWVK